MSCLEPGFRDAVGAFQIRLLLVADLQCDEVGASARFRGVKRRIRTDVWILPFAPLLSAREAIELGMGRRITPRPPHPPVKVGVGPALIFKRTTAALAETPDLPPAINEQLMPLIKRSNLGAS